MNWMMIATVLAIIPGGNDARGPQVVTQTFPSEIRCKRAVEAITRTDNIIIIKWDCVNITKYED